MYTHICIYIYTYDVYVLYMRMGRGVIFQREKSVIFQRGFFGYFSTRHWLISNARELPRPCFLDYLDYLDDLVSGFLGFLVSGLLGFWVSGFLSFLVSWFLGFLVSGFPGFWVSGFLGFRVSGFHGFWVSWFLGFWVSWFLGKPTLNKS